MTASGVFGLSDRTGSSAFLAHCGWIRILLLAFPLTFFPNAIPTAQAEQPVCISTFNDCYRFCIWKGGPPGDSGGKPQSPACAISCGNRKCVAPAVSVESVQRFMKRVGFD